MILPGRFGTVKLLKSHFNTCTTNLCPVEHFLKNVLIHERLATWPRRLLITETEPGLSNALVTSVCPTEIGHGSDTVQIFVCNKWVVINLFSFPLLVGRSTPRRCIFPSQLVYFSLSVTFTPAKWPPNIIWAPTASTAAMCCLQGPYG